MTSEREQRPIIERESNNDLIWDRPNRGRDNHHVCNDWRQQFLQQLLELCGMEHVKGLQQLASLQGSSSFQVKPHCGVPVCTICAYLQTVLWSSKRHNVRVLHAWMSFCGNLVVSLWSEVPVAAEAEE
jgi:hypothetical protein